MYVGMYVYMHGTSVCIVCVANNIFSHMTCEDLCNMATNTPLYVYAIYMRHHFTLCFDYAVQILAVQFL
jgi:hypothetical protein